MQSLTVKTPAKINLTLDILKKRKDGYHEISSIMQAVSLYDEITLTMSESASLGNIIEITGSSTEIPYDNRNIAYKSASEYLKKNNITGKKVSVYIKKNIPVSAGLAGGSSNAAGVLYSLNKIFDGLCDEGTLNEIASKIGSDVPFILTGGTAFASSRGEILEKLPTPELNIVLVKPKNIAVSAKDAYESYSAQRLKIFKGASEEMSSAIKKHERDKIPVLLYNDLEIPVFKMHSEIMQTKEKLIESGCLNALMSGSGSAVFGIYAKKPNSDDFPVTQYDVFYVKTVSTGIIELKEK